MDKNNYTLITVSLLFFLLITFIIYFPDKIPLPFFEKYLPYNVITGVHSDWISIINAKRCVLQGYDVYIDNPCHSVGKVWVYGKITLLLPFVGELNFFYQNIIPNIINFIFILVILKILNPKNLREILFIFIILISQPFILILERANIDLIIFLFFVLMAYNNNNLTNHISILITTLAKFYPITLVSIFLFSGKLKNILLNLFIFLTLIITLLIFQLDSLVEIFSNRSIYSAGLNQFNYSFYLMPKIFFYVIENHIQVINVNKNIFYIIYCFIFFLIFLWNIIYVKKNRLFNNFDFSNFNQRLFFIGLMCSVSCYFLLNNILYREIFLILLIPYLINLNPNENNPYLRNLKNLIYLKLLIPSFLALMKIFFYPEIDLFKGVNLVIKSSVDNLLLVLLLSNLIYIIFNHILKIFSSKKSSKKVSYKL
jgi:hypothetical protein